MRALTKDDLKKLKIGDRIAGEGLEIRKSDKGLAFYASTQVQGVRLRDHLGSDADGMNLTKARVALRKLKDKVPRRSSGVTARPSITFNDAADLYLKTLKDTGGKNIHQKMQQLRDHLRDEFGRMKVASLSTLAVEKYAQKRLDEGAKTSTVNRELATLQHMLRLVDEWGVVETSHVSVKTKKDDGQRRRTFSEAQIAKIIEAAKNDIDPLTGVFFEIGFLTGMRHREILRIRFDDYDYDSNLLTIPEAKAGARLQPGSDALATLLKSEMKRQNRETGYVFENASTAGHRDSMKSQFKRVMRTVGLENAGFTPHCMRHTVISIVMRSGASIADAQRISGHKTTQMLMHYAHHNNVGVQAGMNALANVVNQGRNGN